MIKNPAKLYGVQYLTSLFLFFFLCPLTWAESIDETQVLKKIVGPYDLSVADYLTRAEKQQGDEQQNLLLLAAGRLISEHLWQQALIILSQTTHLNAAQENEKILWLAKIDLIKGNPEESLKKIQKIHQVESLSLYLQSQYHEVLAEIDLRLKKNALALAERIKLETLLSKHAELINNRQALWLNLMAMSSEEIQAMSDEVVTDSELQGWLQLAQLSQHTQSKDLLIALKQWKINFSTHPANSFLPTSLDEINNKLAYSSKKIALLLPLSGPFSGPGNAVYDGFMAAYKKGKEEKKLITYDTNKANVAQIYEQAISEGADYVIGPLTKSDVTAVAGLWHPVPTILLNDAEHIQANAYSFSLSPSYEAKELAIQASLKGYKSALVLAPNNAWGDEIVRAFKAQWQQEGGSVAGVLSYNVDYKIKEDFNKKIRDFLQIPESEHREQQMKELLGYSLSTLPSRRQDFDMVFLLAHPSKARQIMPALKYYYLSDVPVFATSSVYAGHKNVLKDKDLDGIIFCDLPWVFSHQMSNKNWPEQFNSYSRLYALGGESYELAQQLNQLLLFPANKSNAQRGSFYLKEKQFARMLEWGQFKEGQARSLKTMA